jgi:hypothetical protein
MLDTVRHDAVVKEHEASCFNGQQVNVYTEDVSLDEFEGINSRIADQSIVECRSEEHTCSTSWIKNA